MLTLVACVDSVSEQSMYKEYMLNDGTGRLKAHWYVDGDRVPPQQVVRPGVYVRVYGTLQSWQGQEGLNVVQVTKVVQANEIAYHFIEVAHIHLSLTGQLVKGASADVAPLAAPGGGAACGGGGLQAFGAGGCHQAPPQSGVVVSGSYEQQQLQGAPQLGAGGGGDGWRLAAASASATTEGGATAAVWSRGARRLTAEAGVGAAIAIRFLRWGG